MPPRAVTVEAWGKPRDRSAIFLFLSGQLLTRPARFVCWSMEGNVFFFMCVYFSFKGDVSLYRRWDRLFPA